MQPRSDAVLGVMQLGGRERNAGSIQAEAARMAAVASRKLYVAVGVAGDGGEAGLTPALLRDLAYLFEGVASVNPRLYTVPLLPWAGWTAERVAGLEDVAGVVLKGSCGEAGPPAAGGAAVVTPLPAAGDPERLKAVAELLEQGGWGVAPAASLRLPAPGSLAAQGLQVPCVAPEGAAAAGDTAAAGTAAAAAAAAADPAAERRGSGQDAEGTEGVSGSCPAAVLRYSRVALGGTFDRLHCGHMLLLASTALVSVDSVFMGVTDDALLANKAHKELLQHYQERRDAAVQYLQLVRPGLKVEAGPLRDPKKPTTAELDPSMQALVVSAETLVGGEQINVGRRARGLQPLQLVVVGLVGAHRPGDSAGGSKLSSTELREADSGVGAAPLGQ